MLAVLAVLGALGCVRFLAGVGTFRPPDVRPRVVPVLGGAPAPYQRGQLRSDRANLLAQGLVLPVAGKQTDQVTPAGFRRSVLYLQVLHEIYAPLTAGTLVPEPGAACLPAEHRGPLDRWYAARDQALQTWWEHLDIRTAGWS